MTRFIGRSRLNERQKDPRFIALVLAAFSVAMALSAILQSAIPALAMLAVLLVLVAIPTRIDVGMDGVRIAWLGGRFIPYCDVAGVTVVDRDVALELGDGPAVLLPIAPKNRASNEQEKRDALVETASAALKAYRLQPPPPRAVPLIAANNDVHDPYRGAGEDVDALWRTAEQPNAPIDARVAAARALPPFVDDAGRERLRAAALQSAHPAVRVALRRASTAKR